MVLAPESECSAALCSPRCNAAGASEAVGFMGVKLEGEKHRTAKQSELLQRQCFARKYLNAFTDCNCLSRSTAAEAHCRSADAEAVLTSLPSILDILSKNMHPNVNLGQCESN